MELPELEYRVTGRSTDGGILVRVDGDRDALVADIEGDGYEVVGVEVREVSEWTAEAIYRPACEQRGEGIG